MVRYYESNEGGGPVNPDLVISTLYVSKTSIFNEEVSMLSSLHISGNTLINGNLEINGDVSFNNASFGDNILLINAGQTGMPSNTLLSGIEIDRGDLENYQIVYSELDNSLRFGSVSSLKE